ncbi:hypothetical protein NPIL_231341, partial [Nephila pilipes]
KALLMSTQLSLARACHGVNGKWFGKKSPCVIVRTGTFRQYGLHDATLRFSVPAMLFRATFPIY